MKPIPQTGQIHARVGLAEAERFRKACMLLGTSQSDMIRRLAIRLTAAILGEKMADTHNRPHRCPDCDEAMKFQQRHNGVIGEAGADYECPLCLVTWRRIQGYNNRLKGSNRSVSPIQRINEPG